jgi:hypothetical protein
MSLEQALADNTAALNKLIALMEKQNVSTALSTIASAPSETLAASVPKAETPKAETPKAEAPAGVLTYADIRGPFLALVAANEKAALDILSDLGIKSLKVIEDKPDQFADVLARIQKAQGS